MAERNTTMRNKFLGTGEQGYHNLLLILLATGLVLVTEIVNSSIEALCDFVEERHNEKIKIIKDIAAAAVGISIVVWGVVCAVEVGEIWVYLKKQ